MSAELKVTRLVHIRPETVAQDRMPQHIVVKNLDVLEDTGSRFA